MANDLPSWRRYTKSSLPRMSQYKNIIMCLPVSSTSITCWALAHHRVLPAEAPERVENINVEKLHSIVKDQGHIHSSFIVHYLADTFSSSTIADTGGGESKLNGHTAIVRRGTERTSLITWASCECISASYGTYTHNTRMNYLRYGDNHLSSGSNSINPRNHQPKISSSLRTHLPKGSNTTFQGILGTLVHLQLHQPIH